MSKLDELKERLGILKFWLGVIVGVFTAVFGWIVTTYKTQDTILLIIATIFLLGLLIAFFKLNQNIEKAKRNKRYQKIKGVKMIGYIAVSIGILGMAYIIYTAYKVASSEE